MTIGRKAQGARRMAQGTGGRAKHGRKPLRKRQIPGHRAGEKVPAWE